MIDQKILNIKNSLDKHAVNIEMFVKLDTPIKKLKVSNQPLSTDTFYRRREDLITVEDTLIKLDEYYYEVSKYSDVEIISPSITRLVEFPTPIPGTSVVRWNDLTRSFEYVSQLSLGLSAGTSVFDLEHFPAGSDNSILVADDSNVYLENTNAILRGQYLTQTNGTINLSTCSNYCTFYIDGSQVVFEGSDTLTHKNFRIVNTSQTTMIRFDGDYSVAWPVQERTGNVFFELAFSSPNVFSSYYDHESLDTQFFMIGF